MTPDQREAEVIRRIPLVQSLPHGVTYGLCSTCWGTLPHYRGGMCDLCVEARERVLTERWEKHDDQNRDDDSDSGSDRYLPGLPGVPMVRG